MKSKLGKAANEKHVHAHFENEKRIPTTLTTALDIKNNRIFSFENLTQCLTLYLLL